jgi:hypothetical protein
LSETFLKELAETWQTHGKAALEQCAKGKGDIMTCSVTVGR